MNGEKWAWETFLECTTALLRCPGGLRAWMRSQTAAALPGPTPNRFTAGGFMADVEAMAAQIVRVTDTIASQRAPPGPLELDCGAAEPHRVLELNAEAVLVAGGPTITRLGERLYYIAGTSKIGEDGPVAQDATVYSTGPCGEDPAVIASDVWRVFKDPSFPGLTLGCRGSASGDLVELDTTGATGPRLLLAAGSRAGPRSSSSSGYLRASSLRRKAAPNINIFGCDKSN